MGKNISVSTRALTKSIKIYCPSSVQEQNNGKRHSSELEFKGRGDGEFQSSLPTQTSLQTGSIGLESAPPLDKITRKETFGGL